MYTFFYKLQNFSVYILVKLQEQKFILCSYFSWKSAVLHLLVPSLHPGIGADGLEVLLEELAGFVVLALYLLAALEIHIVLPAVPGLILVRKSGVKRDGLGKWHKFFSHGRMICATHPNHPF